MNDLEKWRKLIQAYLEQRRSVSGALLLADSRHFPLAADIDAAEWLDSLHLPYVLVFTKVDKLNQSEMSKLIKAETEFCTTHPACVAKVKTSVTKKRGREDLEKAVRSLFAGSAEETATPAP